MTKNLILLRHGEAAFGGQEQQDFDRHLTEKGQTQAKEVSAFLEEHSLPSLYTYLSPAKRTLETYGCLSENLIHETKLSRQIYEGRVEDMRDLLLETPDDEKAVLIVGHNPTLSWFVELLTCEPLQFHTGGCAVLECHGNSWTEVIYERWMVSAVNSCVGMW